MAELLPRVAELAVLAKSLNVGLTIDAEEVNRLDLSLELFGSLAAATRGLKDWNGLGLAVQAYGKRAKPVLEWLANLARRQPARVCRCASSRAPIGIRKSSARRKRGFEAYPLFTRKVSTDVSYLACARFMLAQARCVLSAVCHPQCPYASRRFRSWRAMTGGYEFQRLHGMGQALYEQVVGPGQDEPALPHLCARRQP